jgi:hypothetical protein
MKMLSSKAIRGRGGCDCPDCSVPKKTQRNREEQQWLQDYMDEMREQDCE